MIVLLPKTDHDIDVDDHLHPSRSPQDRNPAQLVETNTGDYLVFIRTGAAVQ